MRSEAIESKWFIFYKNSYLINVEKEEYNIPTAIPSFINTDAHKHTFESVDGENCMTTYINELPNSLPKTYQFIDLRDSYDVLSLTDYNAAGMAYQLVYWDINTQYCPVCGSKTEQANAIMKHCATCGKEQYPTINTASIVLITKGDELLLARGKNFRKNFYGLIAGFLEVGETIEACVHREVYEETHLKIKNLKFFGTQTWPYPSGLMVGFTAEYESGDIRIQEDELKSAAFFHKDNLPTLPQKLSLARKLIDHWLEKHQ